MNSLDAERSGRFFDPLPQPVRRDAGVQVDRDPAMPERDEMTQREHRAVRVVRADVVVFARHVREAERPLHQDHRYVDRVQRVPIRPRGRRRARC